MQRGEALGSTHPGWPEASGHSSLEPPIPDLSSGLLITRTQRGFEDLTGQRA